MSLAAVKREIKRAADMMTAEQRAELYSDLTALARARAQRIESRLFWKDMEDKACVRGIHPVRFRRNGHKICSNCGKNLDYEVEDLF